MAENTTNHSLKKYLLSNGLLEPKKVEDLTAKSVKTGKDFEEILLENKIFEEKELTLIKGKVFGLPVADLSELEIQPATINLLPQKVSLNYNMLIFAFDGKNAKIGLVNPGDFLAHEAVEFLAKENGWKLIYFVISLYDFRRLSKQYSSFKKELSTALESAEEKFAGKDEELKIKTSDQFDERVKTAPVAKIISVIIRHAIEGRASDIHIEPGRLESRIRYRVDGILRTSLSLPTYLHNSLISRIKVLANLRLDESRIAQDGRIRTQFDGKDVDLRVSVLPMLNSEKVVIRVLDASSGVPNLKELGFADFQMEMIERNIKRPFGVILLTGPTGSGKTTTLYSLLNLVTGDGVNVTTLEDPIEYYIDGVNQSQVNAEVGFNFVDGLRAILRQDPNVIMVGEVRDNETAELVVHAGLTGHLVFSTLHTNDAWGAIPRLIDMKAEPFLLASTLSLVMAQRLVRKLCPDCLVEKDVPNALRERLSDEIKDIPSEYLKDVAGQIKFYQSSGCAGCGNTGYVGRTVINEMIEMTNGIKELVAQEKFDFKLIEAELKKQKYISLRQDAIIKALKGLTSLDEVIRVTQN